MSVVRLSEVLRPRLVPLATGPVVEGKPVFSVRPPSDSLQEARLDLILQMREELGIKDADLTVKEEDEKAAGSQDKAKRLLATMKFPDIVKSIKFNNALENLDILHSIVWTDTVEPAFASMAEVKTIDRALKKIFLDAIEGQRKENGEMGESKPGALPDSTLSTAAGS